MFRRVLLEVWGVWFNVLGAGCWGVGVEAVLAEKPRVFFQGRKRG